MDDQDSNESIYWEEELETQNDRDWMTIEVEVKTSFQGGDPDNVADLQRRIVEALHSDILVTPEVRFVPMGTIAVPEIGKAKKVIDKRTL